MIEEVGAFLFEKIKNIPRHLLIPLILLALGLIFFVYGLIQFMSFKDTGHATAQTSSHDTVQVKTTLSTKQIVVDIEGAVEHPGVYSMPADSRLQDALVLAGGLSSNADRLLIAKQLNMASKLNDSAKIYIPRLGESQPSVLSASTTSGGSSAVTVSGLININTSSSQELDSLPGVGAVTAAKIIGGRPYNTTDELVSKKIVSKKIFDQIKEKITL